VSYVTLQLNVVFKFGSICLHLPERVRTKRFLRAVPMATNVKIISSGALRSFVDSGNKQFFIYDNCQRKARIEFSIVNGNDIFESIDAISSYKLKLCRAVLCICSSPTNKLTLFDVYCYDNCIQHKKQLFNCCKIL